MKIILTSNTSWNLAHFRAGLIRALIADGHEIVALAPADRGIDTLEGMGARFRRLDMDNKGLSPLRDGMLFGAMRRHLRQEKPDAVLSFTIKNNIYGALAAAPRGILFLPNVSGLGTAFLGSSTLQRLVVALYRRAFGPLRYVFFQNTDDAGLFLEHRIVRQRQVRILPGSGIDLARFVEQDLPSEEDDAVTFLLIARMLRDKGVAEYVAAAQSLHANNPKLRFQLLGEADAPNRTAISQAQIDDWVAQGGIEYLGTTSDVRGAITRADCIVLPSYREGTPRTLLEGAAMARPLVATDVPGCREVVKDRSNGFLCRLQDAGDLARAMQAMVDAGRGGRRLMGAAGRQLVEDRFDENKVIDQYREVLAEAAPVANGLEKAGLTDG